MLINKQPKICFLPRFGFSPLFSIFVNNFGTIGKRLRDFQFYPQCLQHLTDFFACTALVAIHTDASSGCLARYLVSVTKLSFLAGVLCLTSLQFPDWWEIPTESVLNC